VTLCQQPLSFISQELCGSKTVKYFPVKPCTLFFDSFGIVRWCRSLRNYKKITRLYFPKIPDFHAPGSYSDVLGCFRLCRVDGEDVKEQGCSSALKLFVREMMCSINCMSLVQMTPVRELFWAKEHRPIKNPRGRWGKHPTDTPTDGTLRKEICRLLLESLTTSDFTSSADSVLRPFSAFFRGRAHGCHRVIGPGCMDTDQLFAVLGVRHVRALQHGGHGRKSFLQMAVSYLCSDDVRSTEPLHQRSRPELGCCTMLQCYHYYNASILLHTVSCARPHATHSIR
jgi:hypothetical protein